MCLFTTITHSFKKYMTMNKLFPKVKYFKTLQCKILYSASYIVIVLKNLYVIDKSVLPTNSLASSITKYEL